MDIDQLENAIIAANPDMTNDQKEMVHRNCGSFSKFLRNSSTSSSVCSEMVIIDHALAFDNFQRFVFVSAANRNTGAGLQLEASFEGLDLINSVDLIKNEEQLSLTHSVDSKPRSTVNEYDDLDKF